MSRCKTVQGILLGTTAAFLSGTAVADTMGLMNGRSADISSSAEQSVEAGANFGSDYRHLGVRFNYKLNENTVLYGDLGQTEFFESDNIAFGAGAFYELEDVISSTDFAVHGSVHRSSFEGRVYAQVGNTLYRTNFDYDLNVLLLEGMFSGKEALNASGTLFWNANAGLALFDGRGGSDMELVFGAGLSMPFSSASGEFYVGVEYLDEMSFGGGYRHFLK